MIEINPLGDNHSHTENCCTTTQQLEVVPPAFTVSGTNNLLNVQIHDPLNLEGVSLFLAAVKALLIQLWTLNGRFTHIYRERLGWVKLGEQMLFSGSLNLPERIKVVSTQCRVWILPRPDLEQYGNRCDTLANIAT